MRQNTRGFFHKAIITLFCCGILVGCGYKTNPVYVDKDSVAKQNMAKQK